MPKSEAKNRRLTRKKLVGDKRSSLFCIAVSDEVFFIQLPPNDIHETEKENNITKAQTNTMTWLRILCTAVNKLECLNLAKCSLKCYL